MLGKPQSPYAQGGPQIGQSWATIAAQIDADLPQNDDIDAHSGDDRGDVTVQPIATDAGIIQPVRQPPQVRPPVAVPFWTRKRKWLLLGALALALGIVVYVYATRKKKGA